MPVMMGVSRWVRPPAGELDLSAAAVTDADLGPLDDDRDRSLPLRVLQHLVELRLVDGHVVVLHLVLSGLVRLTGGRGVRSGVFSEDAHDVGHYSLPDDPAFDFERWGAS